MANPQLENGFTQVANEIMEALYESALNGTQYRIILFIIRATYGYQKSEHDISISFISKGTGIAERQVKRELSSLIEMKVIRILKEATFTTSRKLGINKDHSEWGLNSHQVTNRAPDDELAITPGDRLDTSPGDGLVTQKRKDKEKINKKNDESQKSINKKVYGEFLNVKLSDTEYEKLISQYGNNVTNDFVEKLSMYIESTGKKYKSHYATILTWLKKEPGIKKTDCEKPTMTIDA